MLCIKTVVPIAKLITSFFKPAREFGRGTVVNHEEFHFFGQFLIHFWER